MDAALNDEAVENLVTQFSSSLDFYRELVQNSIDAGSSSVEVWMEFEPGDGVEGTISIHVDDFGEGMNEEIIDQQLTKLFSSTKENDLTKIGKFGIGFVSVFALRPKGVLVQTGRDGECWEVFFHEDRSFVKSRLETPVEGTQITMFVEGGRGRYRELVRGTREALKKWCAHSDTEISFEDRSPSSGDGGGFEPINAPFEVAADLSIRVEHPGTEISVGFSHAPVYGFYNKGLALAVTSAGNAILEGRAERFRHVAFKIKSRYLEHTLSRETVMRDANFDKAMTLLERSVAGPLRTAALDELEALCGVPRWSLAERTRYETVMGHLASEPRETLGDLGERSILRTVDGRSLTLDRAKDAFDRNGRVFIADAPSPLTATLAESGVPVFLGGGIRLGESAQEPVSRILASHLWLRWRSEPVGFARRLLGQDLLERVEARVVHPESVYVHATVLEQAPADAIALLRDAVLALAKLEEHYGDVVLGTLQGGPEPCLFAMGPTLAPVMQRPVSGVYERGWLERPAVVVNVEHAHFRELLRLGQQQRTIAAYCLAKALLLGEDRSLDEDQALAHAARQVAR
ncbi:MAG: ATP-binding protein [Nannocystaceae bacterium]|nr:ATP-binding protein [bacterium]